VTKKKEDVVADNHTKSEASLASLILDCPKDKYRLVALATRWAHEIKKRDQDPLPPQLLLDKSLKEILTGVITMEKIEELPPAPKTEYKAMDLIFKPAPEKLETVPPEN
jgi:DNA-directed RNA polymerase subunit K/omega